VINKAAVARSALLEKRQPGATLGKVDVVKAWKPEMNALGFVYRGNMFQLQETIDQPLHFAISIQRNLRSETYMIQPTILIKSPLEQDSRWQVLVMGKLCPNGVYLHVRNGAWWPPETLPEALDGVRSFAVPWFRAWGKTSFLVEKHEIAIRERKHLIDVLEPLSSEQREAIARVWPRPADSDWRVPPMTFYCASILHYLAGDREMAILRTKDWLARLDPDNINEREQAQTQLNLLVRIH
jgi:hypothetical protein